ncbi:Panacea domain-containing protein [Candidatus Phytoplasma australiense]|uniref:Phage-Associated Protein n=1 Tax=Strawberry lethal yellows phytoplasma (CPA) str. NZSb11 TaxID=980422 RepID=R4S151_PHYAS|nr:type II toxin-antitoxin system antitoxin SocA domain-containing protein [Candidatus Phytoplasma australiense]AGL90111.1 Phage-Associated Protein [Strawberry lethal yellows phytoplasma (CPA) str. NZSb11]AGL90514.1 Phage-Associated Protein [Strawberry lethal yellows phytoplasma (CPA) str. NZSb11]
MKNNNQINVFDVAKYLLDNCPQKYGTGITQMQKLLYYAQAEYLIHYRQPLFEEEIQAWPLGPVVAHVYYEFVRCMAEDKDLFETKCSKNPLPDKVIKILNLVIKKHGTKTPNDLIEQTHNEDPWKNIYHPNKKFSNSVISNEQIYVFFKNRK